MPCHYVKCPDTENLIFIPECWGAVADPRQCTCGIVDGSKIEQLEAALLVAERGIEYLRERSAYERENARILKRNNNKLRRRIRELIPPS